MISSGPIYNSYDYTINHAWKGYEHYYRIYTNDDGLDLPDFNGKAVVVISLNQNDLSDFAHLHSSVLLSGTCLKPVLEASAHYINAYIRTNGFEDKDGPSTIVPCCFCFSIRINRHYELYKEAESKISSAQGECGVRIQILEKDAPEVKNYRNAKKKVEQIVKSNYTY